MTDTANDLYLCTFGNKTHLTTEIWYHVIEKSNIPTAEPNSTNFIMYLLNSSNLPLRTFDRYQGYQVGDFLIYDSEVENFTEVPMDFQLLNFTWSPELDDPNSAMYQMYENMFCQEVIVFVMYVFLICENVNILVFSLF